MVYAIVNSSTATRLQAYAGTIGSGLLILDPQLEVSSFATPFVDGTRSDTQAIIDLTGTYTPAATSLTYNSDNTFSFGGPATSNRITVGIGSYPIDASDPFSIECWIKIPNGADWQDSITFGGNSGTGIVSRGGYGGAIGLWTVDGGSLDGRLKFTIRTSGTQHAGSVDASYDQWYHLIGTYNGLDATTNNMSFYVNGIWDSSVTFTDQGDAFDQQNWIVGGNNALGGTNGGYVTADIPIVRIYSKALSAAEVKQNFIAQRKQFGL